MLTVDSAAVPGSAQIFLRGNLYVRGSIRVVGKNASALENARHDKLADRIGASIDTGAELEAIGDFELSLLDKCGVTTVVVNNACFEGAPLEGVTIQVDDLINKGLLDVIHSLAPVVVCTSTVAEAGGVTSAPGEGETEEAP